MTDWMERLQMGQDVALRVGDRWHTATVCGVTRDQVEVAAVDGLETMRDHCDLVFRFWRRTGRVVGGQTHGYDVGCLPLEQAAATRVARDQALIVIRRNLDRIGRHASGVVELDRLERLSHDLEVMAGATKGD